MPDTPASAAAPADRAAPARERRTNRRLRELIDEMLASVRFAVNRDLWTADERQATEAELAVLMAAVRREALTLPPRHGTSA